MTAPSGSASSAAATSPGTSTSPPTGPRPTGTPSPGWPTPPPSGWNSPRHRGPEQVHLEAAAPLARDDIDVIDVCPLHLHRGVVRVAPASMRWVKSRSHRPRVLHNYLFLSASTRPSRTGSPSMLGMSDREFIAAYESRRSWAEDQADAVTELTLLLQFARW